MNSVAIYNIAGENINYVRFLTNLDFEVTSLSDFAEVMNLTELHLLLCDGKFYLKLAADVKKKLRNRFKNLKIVLTGEFSDSYLFAKAQSEEISDFIVVPFGYKECLNMVERLGFAYSSDILKQESFEE